MRGRRQWRARGRQPARLCGFLAVVGIAGGRLPSAWIGRPIAGCAWRGQGPAAARRGGWAAAAPGRTARAAEEEPAPLGREAAGSLAALLATAGAAVAAARPGEEVGEEELLKRLEADLAALVAVVREAREGGLEPAEVLQERQLLPDVVQYALALRALRLEEQFKSALQLFAAIEGSFAPDVAVYSELMGVHVAMKRWTRVIDTFTRMKRQGLEPTLACYNCLMRAYGEASAGKRAVQLIQDMRQSQIKPDMTTYEFAMLACASSSLDGKRTVKVLDLMKSANEVPSGACYRRAIRALGKLSLWEKSVDLFDEMRSHKVEIDEFTLNSILCYCANAPAGGVVSSIFKRIEADPSITLSELHYDTVICACEKEGNWGEVVSLAGRMSARGCDPHLITCTSVLTACVELGKWEAAFTLLDSVRNADTDTNTLIFAIGEVIRACVQANQWDEIPRLHQEQRLVRRRLNSEGPELVDVRGLPPEVTEKVVRAALREAVQRLAEAEGEGRPTGSESAEDAGTRGPQDVVILVDMDEILTESLGAPGLRRSKAVQGTSAASAVVAAFSELGTEANLQCVAQPFPCVRIPGAALESPLLQQRVKKAVSEFAAVDASAASARGGKGGTTESAATVDAPRSI